MNANVCFWCDKPITRGIYYSLPGSIVNPSKIKMIDILRMNDYVVCEKCFCKTYHSLKRANSPVARIVIRSIQTLMRYIVGPVFIFSIICIVGMSSVDLELQALLIKLFASIMFITMSIIMLIFIIGGLLLIYLRGTAYLSMKIKQQKREETNKEIAQQFITKKPKTRPPSPSLTILFAMGGTLGVLFGLLAFYPFLILGVGLLYIVLVEMGYSRSPLVDLLKPAYEASIGDISIHVTITINPLFIALLIILIYYYRKRIIYECERIKTMYERFS